METFRRPKAPAHAPASHVAWLIALAATPREGHSRSSLVGSWAGVWRSATAQGNGSEEATEAPARFRRPKAPASHVAWLIALAATPREGHSRWIVVGGLLGRLTC